MARYRNHSMDVLKVVATMAIVFHHYQQISGAFFSGKLNFFGGKYAFGLLVELFFVISGYCMANYIDLIRNGLKFKDFYLKRAKRLLPLVACAAVVSEILCIIYDINGWYWRIDIEPDLFRMLANALGIQTGWVFVSLAANSPTWYVSVLMLCYVIFYLLTYISSKWKISVKYFYLLMVLIGCGVCVYEINLPFLNFYSSRGYYAFFFGVLLGMWLMDRVLSKDEVLVALAVCGIIVYCGINHYDYIRNNVQFTLTFVFYPALIVIMNCKFLQSIFMSSFWGEAAKISYNMYIWHVPVLMVLEPVLAHFGNYNNDRNNMGYMFLYGGVVVVIGIISRLIIERTIEKKWKQAG